MVWYTYTIILFNKRRIFSLMSCQKCHQIVLNLSRNVTKPRKWHPQSGSWILTEPLATLLEDVTTDKMGRQEQKVALLDYGEESLSSIII